MAYDDQYSIDTSAMVDWWVRYYPPKAFGGLVPRMEKLIADGRVRASREVLDELERQDDECFRWARNQKLLFVDSHPAIQSVVARPMGAILRPREARQGNQWC